MCRFAGESGKFDKVLKDLYRDLTDPEHKNENGHVISKEFCDKTLGGNYWHSWRNGNPPKRYKLWLDGIYMLQPFIARYAALIGDKAQALKIADRLEWVCDNMQSENGLYFHAANSEKDVCPFFWTRATGWYCMALVDVAEAFSGKEGKEAERVVSVCKRALQKFTEGIIPYREKSGLWKNLADMPKTATNREEVSGTSMIVYAILKGIRLGILDKKYAQIAKEGFVGMCETKLDEGLKDIYFKASASGVNNYETPEDYLTDEGKGVGPFIMAYSEIIRG